MAVETQHDDADRIGEERHAAEERPGKITPPRRADRGAEFREDQCEDNVVNGSAHVQIELRRS